MITEVSKKPLTALSGEQEIDGQGKFLMPDFIDTHVDLAWNLSPMQSNFAATEYF